MYTCRKIDIFYQRSRRYEEKNTAFACFKTYVNYLSESALSSNDIIIYIVQTQPFCESQIPKEQN